MEESYYKINEFSKIIGVTPKALRLYESLSLFKPALIDDKTGYRYYTLAQIKDAALIIQLKAVGFSLADISEYLKNQLTIKQKLALLEKKRETINHMLLGLAHIEKTNADYSAYIKTESEISVLSKRVFVKTFNELADEFFVFSESQAILRHRLAVPQYYTVEYLDGDYREREINAVMRIGIIAKKGDNSIDTVPETTYLTTIHRGDYDTMYKAYSYLNDYMRIYNITPIGNPSERFFENYAIHTDSSNYLTEVRYPIQNTALY